MALDFKSVITVVSMVIAAVSAFFAWQISTQEGINKLTSRVQKLENRPVPLSESQIGDIVTNAVPAEPVAGVPSGAVVAFDLRGCPEVGWTNYAEAQSRMIVGAALGTGFAPGFGKDGRGEPLTDYKSRGHGGEENVKLTIEEMPSHTHGYNSENGVSGGHSGVSNATYERVEHDTGPSGGDQPHYNMPPYIALYFCIKD